MSADQSSEIDYSAMSDFYGFLSSTSLSSSLGDLSTAIAAALEVTPDRALSTLGRANQAFSIALGSLDVVQAIREGDGWEVAIQTA